MKASRFLGLIIVLTLLITLSQTMVRDSAGTAFTANAYDVAGNTSEQSTSASATAQAFTGDTIYAASCSQTDVLAAINSASPGDTVIVPAGNCTWSSGVSIPNDKKITLQGAGMDLTVITGSGVSMNQSGSRLTGLGFINGQIHVDGDGWRVDHCKIYKESFDYGIRIFGYRENHHATGLIDNCVFFNTRVMVYGWAGLLSHSLWAQPIPIGSGDDVVYVEDCTFTSTVFSNAIDAHYGGRYVFRYNTVTGAHLEAHGIKGDSRAARSWEIYNNNVNQISQDMNMPFRIRAGTGVIFGNNITGTFSNPGIGLDNPRSYGTWGDAGYCDGTSPWDGNEDATGWPCRDQIGRSTDQWLWTDANPYPPQASAPAYLWLNRVGGNILPAVVINNGGDHIKNNRDFYDETASFDGTSGTGTGILANRPSTCTTNVGYWATDQGEWNSESPGPDGQLYKCTATDTWELYYTPYTYPHPLRGESLVLHGVPQDQAIHLTWQVGASLPPTSTWQITYDGPAGDQPSPISGIISPTRAYTLTGLTNHTWYTVTLNAMLDGTPFLTDTVRVMPSDIFVYLPIVLKGP